jgi:hypothetical protein
MHLVEYRALEPVPDHVLVIVGDHAAVEHHCRGDARIG